MPTLHVRSVPDELYNRLQKLAQDQSRSLSAEVITLLSQALEQEERRKEQRQLLTALRRRRFRPPYNAPDVVHLLHEDRGR